MSEREEYTPSMDRVRHLYARTIRPDGTVELASRRQKEFDRWLAANNQEVREQVAREIKASENELATLLDLFVENEIWESTGAEMARRIIASMRRIARGEGSE